MNVFLEKGVETRKMFKNRKVEPKEIDMFIQKYLPKRNIRNIFISAVIGNVPTCLFLWYDLFKPLTESVITVNPYQISEIKIDGMLYMAMVFAVVLMFILMFMLGSMLGYALLCVIKFMFIKWCRHE